MNCVCAFTAKHLSLLPSGEIWSTAAARYYGTSLRMLIRSLHSSNPHQGNALTATILLSSYEMIAAQGQEHQRHFYGAMTLIQMYGINARCQGIDRANFWIYIRHEIVVALVNEMPLQLSPKEWNVNWRESNVEEDILSNQLIWLVGRAIDVAYTHDSSSLQSRARQDLLIETTTWFKTLPISFQGVKYGDPDDLGFAKMYFAVPAAGKSTHALNDINVENTYTASSRRNDVVPSTFYSALCGAYTTRFLLYATGKCRVVGFLCKWPG
jgi:hypothetical protein